MTDKEVMQMALDALEGAIDAQVEQLEDHISKYGDWYKPKRIEFMKKEIEATKQSIEALRTALAQPKPKPVATLWQHDETGRTRIITPDMLMDLDAKWFKVSDLYTTLPQREWVGLTYDEITQGNKESWVAVQAWQSACWWAEAKLKDKNT